MFVPPLLPDELLLGYRARLATIHHAERAQVLHQALQEHYEVPPGFVGRSSFVGCLATALNRPVNELLQNHTLMPLIAAFPDETEAENHVGRHLADTSSGSWLRLTRERLALCPDCIADDLEAYQFSFWRRSHQQPGLFHCGVHRVELRFIPPPQFLLARPDELLDSADFAEDGALKAADRNQAVARAIELIRATLDSRGTATRGAVTARLQGIAIARNGGLNLKEIATSISSGILQSIPPEWRRDLMPKTGLSEEASFRLVWRTLQPVTLPLSAATTCFVTAMVVDSIGEGLQLLELDE